ncbi:GNAT family N-acetyltransferase [Cryptosporangium aurantiacum]|uniref:Acetyltransferase (GNAT) family protein n=1 Tax=Cryptosporangium aurantiacum TaxID=134849 RepID=A0A1M7HRJ3_9ACTN|nr:GNAT family N-acetyltransferase [Cryptosporangium aurantiacum]SHM31104.1 Acetyltransferase (GNAT) family protein [Cryptosporangium aurantiacum]
MSTAATEIELRPTPFDAPEAVALIAALQQEYQVRYGGHDETPVDPAEFAPPDGWFVVAWIGDTPVGCGGWRAHALPGEPAPVAEIKRMFVAAAARRRGVARSLLTELERTAAAAGFSRLILEAGDQQPEAIALYTGAGFRAAEPFGLYVDEDGSVYFTKDL